MDLFFSVTLYVSHFFGAKNYFDTIFCARYFCISINILEMSSAVQIRSSQNNFKLSVFLGGPSVAYSLRLIYLSIEAILS